MDSYNYHSRPGEIILPRPVVAPVVISLTRCRAPIVPELYAYSLISRKELARRLDDRDAFWHCWDKSVLRPELLHKYQVNYLIDENRPQVSTAGSVGARDYRDLEPATVSLEICFANGHYTVYKVNRETQFP